jgi:O-antigen/teichoic acid export membrane protein
VRRRVGLPGWARGPLLGNIAARLGALGALLAASLLLARHHGAAVVGIYALLHVLPGLLGTVTSSGLAVAAPYFLAQPGGRDPRVPWTLVAMALAGGTLGAATWAAAAPVVGPLLFADVPVWLVAVAGAAVLTRLAVISAKACSQGSDDLRGASGVILFEELLFLPWYLVLTAAGASGPLAVVGGLVAADVATAAGAWARLVRRGFFAGAAPPSARLVRRVAAYGIRGQAGGLIAQLNLRLDYVVLSALAGPAALGIYTIASKLAELVKVVGMALTYVLYPAFARQGPAGAAETAARLIPKAAAATAIAALPLWLAAGIAVPAVYGAAFDGAVTPARIILAGLVLEGAGAVITAYLYGAGRPGQNSIAMAVGLVVTVGLDVALIPAFGATGAAVASAAAYTATTLALGWFFLRARRARRPDRPAARADAARDGRAARLGGRARDVAIQGEVRR